MKYDPSNRFVRSPEGKGGAAAPAAAPNAATKVAEYEPPPLDLDAVLNGTEPQPPPVAAPAAAPKPVESAPPASGEPKEDDDPFAFIEEEPKPPEKKAEPVAEEEPEPSADDREKRANENRGLRDQLAAANARLKELESGRANQETEERIRKLTEEKTAIEERLHRQDPLAHPDVVALRQEMQAKYAQTARQMAINGDNPDFLQGFLQTALPELIQTGDPSGQPYLKKLTEIRDDLKERGVRPESISQVLGLLDAGVENTIKTHAKVNDIKTNWMTYEAKRAREHHEAIAKDWAGVKSGWIKPTPDQLENDPYNPVVFLARAAEGNEKLAKEFEQTSKALVTTFMPLAPIMPEDLEGMDQNQVAEYLERREKSHQSRMEGFRKQVGNMAAFYRMGPGLLRKVKELEDQLAEFKAGTFVPGSEGRTGPTGGDDKKPTNIKEYDPGPIPNI